MTEPTNPKINRSYVTIGENQIHYRYSGKGPVLLLLHSLPRSSEDFNSLILKLNKYFTLIAPDIPGYGQSKIREESENIEYNNFINDFLKSLNIKNVLIYGEQYGGILGLEFANQKPQKVSALVVRDIPIQEDIKNLYPPFKLQWDGSHLTWLWSFLREKEIFYPWNKASLINRLDKSMATTNELQKHAIQFLSSGQNGINYQKGISKFLTW